MKKAVKISAGIILGMLLVLTVAVQVVLNSTFLTRMAGTLADKYVDGNLRFENIRASAVSSFPNLNLSVENFSLTYPHDRFAATDSLWIRNALRSAGRSAEADTLASFRKMTLSLNYLSFIRRELKLCEVTLDGARIFAHRNGGAANWELFKNLSSSDGPDTTSSTLPRIVLKRLHFKGRPLIVFTSPEDSLFASVSMKEALFGGHMDTGNFHGSRISLKADSLDVRGRTASDSVAFGLNRLDIKDRKKAFDVHADAYAFLSSPSLGNIDIPIDLKGEVSFPARDAGEFSLRNLRLTAGTIDLSGEADVRCGTDSTYVRAELLIASCPVQETVRKFLGGAFPEVKDISTDAVADLTALCDGWYVPSRGALPELIAQLTVPESTVAYSGFSQKGTIAVDVNASTDRYGKLDVRLDTLSAGIAGLTLRGSGAADDVLCGDPLIMLSAAGGVRLDTLDYLMPEGMRLAGGVEGELEGMILLSDINPYSFSRADIEGSIRSGGMLFEDTRDTITAFIGPTRIEIGRDNGESALGTGLLGLRSRVDSVFATIGKGTFVRGRDFSLFLQNSESTFSEEFGNERHPIVGTLSAGGLAMFGTDSMFVGVRNFSNRFRISSTEAMTDDGNGGTVKKEVPILSLGSRADAMAMRQGVNRVTANSLSFDISAVMKKNGKSDRRRHFLDSLQKVYPGVRRDSLISMLVRRSGAPDFLLDKSFNKNDIDIHLSESLAKYIRDWTIRGTLGMTGGAVITPYFPLKNSLENVSGEFDNDRFEIKNLTLRSGSSDASLTGTVTGLQRALTDRGLIKARVKLTSDKIRADELIFAYNSGMGYVPPESGSLAMNEGVSDEQYMAEVISGRDGADSTLAALVLPANLDAEISLEGSSIDYAALNVDWFASDIKIKRKTLQIINTVATSNMGDIYLEGFYSTRDDITAGFDLNLAGITADKVITLFPAVDSLMPMLKSFKGVLDCEMAATSRLDTAMNLITPSIRGVMKISGSDLSVAEEGEFKKLARILMFKDRKLGRIQDMSVQGLISDNKLEVFPFVMSVDRYQLAMDGTQNFDQSFRYHISVLKSPLPFRFGVNLTGNFDDWKYRLCKAKYKDANVPVFTTELSDMQYNLVESIHDIFSRGAAAVLKETDGAVRSVDGVRGASGYDAATGDLDDAELKEYDEALGEPGD